MSTFSHWPANLAAEFVCDFGETAFNACEAASLADSEPLLSLQWALEMCPLPVYLGCKLISKRKLLTFFWSLSGAVRACAAPHGARSLPSRGQLDTFGPTHTRADQLDKLGLSAGSAENCNNRRKIDKAKR